MVDLRDTRREKRDARQKDVSFRNKHLDECAEQFSRDQPVSYPNAVKILQHIEKQKRSAQRIRRTLKGKMSGALTYVLIPSVDAYTDKVKSRPDFDIKNMEYIWPRVQIANGKDIACWDITNDKELFFCLAYPQDVQHTSKNSLNILIPT